MIEVRTSKPSNHIFPHSEVVCVCILIQITPPIDPPKQQVACVASYTHQQLQCMYVCINTCNAYMSYTTILITPQSIATPCPSQCYDTLKEILVTELSFRGTNDSMESVPGYAVSGEDLYCVFEERYKKTEPYSPHFCSECIFP